MVASWLVKEDKLAFMGSNQYLHPWWSRKQCRCNRIQAIQNRRSHLLQRWCKKSNFGCVPARRCNTGKYQIRLKIYQPSELCLRTRWICKKISINSIYVKWTQVRNKRTLHKQVKIASNGKVTHKSLMNRLNYRQLSTIEICQRKNAEP